MDQLLTALLTPSVMTTPIYSVPLLIGFMYASVRLQIKENKRRKKHDMQLIHVLREMGVIVSLNGDPDSKVMKLKDLQKLISEMENNEQSSKSNAPK